MLSLFPTFVVLSVFCFLFSPASCDQSPSTNIPTPSNSTASSNSSAVFVYTHVNSDYNTASAGATQFVFALSLVPNGDLYFHMSAPFGNSWMGVGIGAAMPDSLMLIAYPSANGSGITISPRLAEHGYSEPTYTSAITCEKLYGPGLVTPNSMAASNGTNGLTGAMVVDAVCRNVSSASWPGYAALNFTNPAQNFLFAVGPGEPMASDALDAPLRRHAFHGRFTMDLAQAVSEAGVAGPPLPNAANGTYAMSGAGTAFDAAPDNDFAPMAHAALMCLAFIIVFPCGSLAARMFKRIVFHAVVQGLGTLFVVVGFGIAVHVSGQYNRSRNFQSAHQVLGILLFCGVVVQFGIGLLQHRIFKKTQQQPKWAKIHLILGPAVMLLGIVNGGLGLKLANSQYVTKPYIVVVIMVALVYITFRGSMAWCSRRRRQEKTQLESTNGVEGYQYPQFYAVGQAQPPSSYYPPAYGQSFPMQPYGSQHSVPQTIVYPKPADWR